MGAFTGARLSELALAGVPDILTERGITYLRVTDAGEGKNLKNKGSRRRIPIHPQLVARGFLDYVVSLDPKGPLFPGIKPAAYSKRFARLLDMLGLKNKTLVYHSFRHGFVDACRAAQVPEEVRHALTGHVGGGVGRDYGKGVPLSVLAEAVGRIAYHGLSLHRIQS